MSDDNKEISGNDDPTVEIETPKAPTTNMMIEPLILEVRQGFAATNQRLDAIEKRMYSLERKFDVFSIESTEIKANILDARNRLDELERKAS